MVTQHTRNRLSMLSAQATGVGLKVGIPIAAVAAAYLLYVAFGGDVRHFDTMSAADRQYLAASVKNAGLVLQWASVAIALSLVVRFFFTQAVGLPMTLGGALIYFGVPMLFGNVAPSLSKSAESVAAEAVAGLCRAGVIFLAPGVWLALRDGVIRIWEGISANRLVERRLSGRAEKRPTHSMKPLTACWESGYCREVVRDACPAFVKKKSCWRLKMGCLCDERILLQAAAGKGLDNNSYRGIIKSLGLDKPVTDSSLSGKIKRARCRRCAIYLNRQKQKYRLLAPMVFPVVGLTIYWGYDTIVKLVAVGVQKTDRFFSFMTPVTAATPTPESTVRIMTVIVVIWLSVLALCYGFKALEYLIFDLQV